MDLGIEGRRAAVAAGSAGLGLGTAAALNGEGCAVAICGRNRDRLNEAVARLGARAVAIEADLSRPEEAERFAVEAAERLGGPLDIVVANAGGPPPGVASTTDLAGYRAALDLNCLTTIALANAAVGPMRQAGWGRIVAITSIGARQPIPYLAASTTARAAVTAYIKTLSLEVAADGVTANTVQPGSHDTDRIRSLGDGAIDGARAEIPVGHLGDPDDFGAVVAFVCSTHAKFITGASIIVDGGASRGLQ
jgi:3-oxoacyl-[acyl-carrier protein] reductase